MAENDKYPDNEHGTFAPVGFLLVIAVAVVLAIFVYARSQDTVAPSGSAPPPANPTAPVVPGTNIPANPAPSG